MSELTQSEIIIEAVKDDNGSNLIKVSAIAGSGKSYTARQASLALGSGPQLYVVFSKAMQQEAQQTMPKSATVLTIHALAYRYVMKGNLRLDGDESKYSRSMIFLKAKDLSGLPDWDDRYATLDYMEDFFASSSPSYTKFLADKENDRAATYAAKLIKQMFANKIGMTHSGYLKYYHLLLKAKKVKQPTYDLAMVDEVQDISSVALEIFKLQQAHKYLLLGDPYQAIMGTFTRSVNAFEELEGIGTTLPLSKSFRVTEPIAELVQSFCREYIDNEMVFEGMDYPPNPEIKTHMYISKTNAGVVSQMVTLANEGTAFASAREPKRIFELPILLLTLKQGMRVYSPQYKFLERDMSTFYKSPALQAKFGTPLKYLLFAHQGDNELKSAITLMSKHKPKEIFDTAAIATEYYKAGNKADIWVSTAHSSKGLTVDEVTILPDLSTAFSDMLIDFPDSNTWGKGQKELAYLTYVAYTRCRYELNGAIHLNKYKETT